MYYLFVYAISLAQAVRLADEQTALEEYPSIADNAFEFAQLDNPDKYTNVCGSGPYGAMKAACLKELTDALEVVYENFVNTDSQQTLEALVNRLPKILTESFPARFAYLKPRLEKLVTLLSGDDVHVSSLLNPVVGDGVRKSVAKLDEAAVPRIEQLAATLTQLKAEMNSLDYVLNTRMSGAASDSHSARQVCDQGHC